eukprot:9146303-Pyramimonas_sp.AAC.1
MRLFDRAFQGDVLLTRKVGAVRLRSRPVCPECVFRLVDRTLGTPAARILGPILITTAGLFSSMSVGRVIVLA